MSMFTLYILVKMDSIKNFVGIIGIALLVVVILTMLISFINGCIEDSVTSINIYKKAKRIYLPISLVLTMIFVLLPSTKEVAFIYIVGKLSQNNIVKNIGDNALQIPDKALQILNLKMNEYLEEMASDVKQTAENTTNAVKSSTNEVTDTVKKSANEIKKSADEVKKSAGVIKK